MGLGEMPKSSGEKYSHRLNFSLFVATYEFPVTSCSTFLTGWPFRVYNLKNFKDKFYSS